MNERFSEHLYVEWKQPNTHEKCQKIKANRIKWNKIGKQIAFTFTFLLHLSLKWNEMISFRSRNLDTIANYFFNCKFHAVDDWESQNAPGAFRGQTSIPPVLHHNTEENINHDQWFVRNNSRQARPPRQVHIILFSCYLWLILHIAHTHKVWLIMIIICSKEEENEYVKNKFLAKLDLARKCWNLSIWYSKL